MINDSLTELSERGSAIIDATPVFIINSLEYVSDHTKFLRPREREDQLFIPLFPMLKENLLIESLFFIPQRKEKKIFSRDITIRCLRIRSNKLSIYASTDHLSANTGYNQTTGLIEQGLKYFAYTGNPPLSH